MTRRILVALTLGVAALISAPHSASAASLGALGSGHVDRLTSVQEVQYYGHGYGYRDNGYYGDSYEYRPRRYRRYHHDNSYQYYRRGY